MRDQPRRLEVETSDTIYEIEFAQIQIEITGRCNLSCRHCRAHNQPHSDMALEQIAKIVRFATSFGSREIVISGGEPLMHRRFADVLSCVRENGMDFMNLTTNGYLLTDELLHQIEDVGFNEVMLSVSLDSSDRLTHDLTRGRRGSFDRASRALSIIASSRVPLTLGAVRSTVGPEQIDDMENLVRYAVDFGCKRIGFAAVLPVGRAVENPSLIMTREQKKRFLLGVRELAEKYPDVTIGTNDPLQCLLDDGTCAGDREDDLVFSGCSAAVTTFNVNADGTMTPCAMLDTPMMSVFPLTEDEIAERYRRCSFLHDMLELKLKGKCGQCPHKRQCGGCRARAFADCGDYMAEDPDCWR